MNNSAPGLTRQLEAMAHATSDDLQLLTPEEAMGVLKVSRRTLQEMTSKHELPSVLLSRKCRRYPVDGLRRWLAERMEGPLE